LHAQFSILDEYTIEIFPHKHFDQNNYDFVADKEYTVFINSVVFDSSAAPSVNFHAGYRFWLETYITATIP